MQAVLEGPLPKVQNFVRFQLPPLEAGDPPPP
jgi:hypothetical protein